MTTPKRFPILIDRLGTPGPCPSSIPWEAIAPYEGQAKQNHGGQSLERLAERGGLSPTEAYLVMHGCAWDLYMDFEALDKEACIFLDKLVRDSQIAKIAKERDDTLLQNDELKRKIDGLEEDLRVSAASEETLEKRVHDMDCAALVKGEESNRLLSDPIPMILFCPACNWQHIDKQGWTGKPHRTHLCENCKHEWRPSHRSTVGVLDLGPKPRQTEQRSQEASSPPKIVIPADGSYMVNDQGPFQLKKGDVIELRAEQRGDPARTCKASWEVTDELTVCGKPRPCPDHD